MKYRILIVFLSVVLIGIPIIIFAQQEQITITTYYPSPYGNYRELRAQRIAIGDTYIDGSVYCWEGTCTTTINSNADLVVEGNVGIGTTGPNGRLHVSADDTDGAIVGTAVSSALDIWPSSASLGPALMYGSASNLRIGTQTAFGGAGWSEKLRINSNGYLGIGTQSPSAPLHIRTTAGLSQLILQNTNGQWAVRTNDVAANDFGIRNITAGTTPFYITSAGNVGIGGIIPQGRLEVNGAIYQRGVVIHADYVFEPDYKLESIEEHAAYMWQNKHLKAIPKVIKDEKGQDVVEIGAMNKGILEELEKAHLYIEKLNNELKSLKAEIESLKGKI